MTKKNRYSNKYPTKEAAERGEAFKMKCAIDSHRSRIEGFRKKFEKFGIYVTGLTLGVVRLEKDGVKIDLYSDRYFKVNTKERGDTPIFDFDEFILDYFNQQNQIL